MSSYVNEILSTANKLNSINFNIMTEIEDNAEPDDEVDDKRQHVEELYCTTNQPYRALG